jgi:hypothetical protein
LSTSSMKGARTIDIVKMALARLQVAAGGVVAEP